MGKSHSHAKHHEQKSDTQLCRDHLVSHGKLPRKASLQEATEFWINKAGRYCPTCPIFSTCPACSRNQ